MFKIICDRLRTDMWSALLIVFTTYDGGHVSLECWVFQGYCNIKVPTLLQVIQLLANLRIVIVVVATSCRVLDLLDVGMLSEVSGPLNGDTSPQNTCHDTLH